MPNVIPTAAATPGLPAALLAVAPAPAPPGATAEGGDFASVIGNIAGDPMMLDLPPALPGGGTNLPLPRPVFANQPAPLPPDVVEEVMVGCGWQPEVRLGEPAEPVPQLPVPEFASPKLRLPEPPSATPPQLEVADAVQTPGPGKKPWVLHTSSPLALGPAPLKIDLPDCEMPAPGEGPVREPAEDASKALDPAAPPPVIALPAQPLQLTPVAAVPAEPIPAEAEDDEQPAPKNLQTGPVVLARKGGPAVSIMPDAQTEKAEPGREEVTPDQVHRNVPELPASAAPRATVAVASPPARPDISIPPELARQVAQLIRTPATEASPPATPVSPTMDQPALVLQAAAPAPAVAAPNTVATPSSPVDLGRSDWLQAMIDRIGDIAQEDGRREAQIKLLPSALGAVSVKIVERDERMHVTLTSDNAQARQLLSDAAPRLQELAEARGLRFAQTDIGGGQPHDRRPASDQQPQAPLRPRAAAPEQDAQTQPDGDLIA